MTKNYAILAAGCCVFAAWIAIRAPTMEQARACRDLHSLTKTAFFKDYQAGSFIDASVQMCRDKLGPLWYVL